MTRTPPLPTATPDSCCHHGQYRALLRLAGIELDRRNRVIRALTSFTYQASRLTEPAALLNLSLSHALNTTQAEVGAIVLIDPESKMLTLGTHRGLVADCIHILTGKHFDVGAAVLMPHLVTGKGVLVEAHTSTTAEEALLLSTTELSSLASLPLKAGHKLIGALVVGIRDETERLTSADVNYLVAIAQVTAFALESLNLRDKLWHMAESLLSHGDLLASTAVTPDLGLPAELPLLPPLQAKLATAVAELGGAMGALFTINKNKPQLEINLVADYGLSPLFTHQFTSFTQEENNFPFEQLSQRNLLVKNLVAVNRDPTSANPLLLSLQEEGARSLIAVRVNDDDPIAKALFIAATEPARFSNNSLTQLLRQMPKLLALLPDTPVVPTLSTHRVHIPSMSESADMHDLELLLAAMMQAEEEVERHNSDLLALTNISEMLNRTLDLSDTLDEIMEHLQAMLAVDAVWLYVCDDLDPFAKQMILQAYVGLNDDFVRAVHHLSLGDGFEGHVGREAQTAICNDASEQTRRCHLLQRLGGINALASTPLTCPDILENKETIRTVGVLTIGKQQPHHWSPRQIRLLNNVANLLSFAINNAQLYARLKDDVQWLKVGNEFLQQLNDQLMTQL